MNEKYSILMMSDDNYSFLWEQHLDLFYKAWQDCDVEFNICSRNKKYEGKYENLVNSITPGNVVEWSARLIYALNSIKSKYVLFTLDDFYMESKIASSYIDKCVEYMEAEKEIAVFYFSPRKGGKGGTEKYPDFREKDKKKQSFLVNAQIALWNREALLSLLRKHETPWEFESYGSRRARSSPYRFMEWDGKGFVAFPYDWGRLVRRGAWDAEQVKKIESAWNIKLYLQGIGTFNANDKLKKCKNPFILAKKGFRMLRELLFNSHWKKV